MKDNLEYGNRLEDEFPIHKKFYKLPIYTIKTALREGESTQTYGKLINAIRSAGYATIGDLLQTTWQTLDRTYRLGNEPYIMLLNLLQRITDRPSLLPEPLPELIDELEEPEEQPLIRSQEEELQRQQRIEEIKVKLRNMGMIR